MKTTLAVFGVILIFGLQQTVHAASITYDLTNVVFTDGATATGSFDYDPTTPNGGTFGNFDVTTTDGIGDGTTGYHFTTSDSTVIGDQSSFVFGSNSVTGNVLYLFTYDNITGPGSYAIIPGPNQSGEVAPINVRDIASGSIVSAGFASTPEPSGGELMGIATVVLGGLVVRRRLRLLSTDKMWFYACVCSIRT